jgi:hypothetical protein
MKYHMISYIKFQTSLNIQSEKKVNTQGDGGGMERLTVTKEQMCRIIKSEDIMCNVKIMGHMIVLYMKLMVNE